MSNEPIFSIGSRRIGSGQPTYVVAEAGVNHGCNLEIAQRMIREAKAAGADAIKFQNFTANKLVTRWAPMYWMGKDLTDTQYAVFRKRDLFGLNEMKRLAEYCAEQGITLLSTPFDIDWVYTLEKLGVPAFKICSGDLSDRILLSAVAKTGKPVLQSTGAATITEVMEWVERARSLGIRDLCLLHCVLSYPTALEDANLQRICLLKRIFREAVIGYSDHTVADFCIEVAVGAVSLGARIVEKHFTLNRSWPGDDHYHSAEPEQFSRMVDAIRRVERALGVEYDGILPCEESGRKLARRSVVSTRKIRAGELLDESSVIMKRPGIGISSIELDAILGRKAVRDIEEDSMIDWLDLA